MPLKTFARYELLFKQMLKLTPEHRSEEHAGLTTVLEKLEVPPSPTHIPPTHRAPSLCQRVGHGAMWRGIYAVG